MSNVNVPADAKPIELNGHIVDPFEHYALDAQNTNYIIVTARDVLANDQKAELQRLEVEFLADLGNDNLLCRYKPSDLKPLRDLRFVQQVDVYRNIYKIPTILLAMIEKLKKTPKFKTETCLIDVMTHEGVKDLDALANHISKVARVDRSQIQITPNKIRLEVNLGELGVIAADDRVCVLEEVVTPVLFDDQAKKIVNARKQTQSGLELTGKGQTIAVYDGGFDRGSMEDCHPAFTGKSIALLAYGRRYDKELETQQRIDDWTGHGTHVCGTIVGKDIETSEGNVGGVAQDAEVVFWSFATADGDLTKHMPPLGELYGATANVFKAKVHSNSWGDPLLDGKQRPYAAEAYEIDEYVRENPDSLICFSAGNNNSTMNSKPSIGSQAAAKNCLTVGASGSTRKVNVPAPDEVVEVDPDQIYSKSSRGPTCEKRIKPDVVAPGFNIFSALSRHPKAQARSGAEATSKAYPGVKWKIRCGTSHSTPLVSGCALILRQILQKKGLQRPPAALLKSVIINGAHKLPGVDMEAQGFGRIDLQSSMSMLQESPIIPCGSSYSSLSLSPLEGGTLVGASLKQGEKVTFTLAPAQKVDQLKLKITMVYNDLPGAAIQNKLNLTVTDNVTGVTKHGGIPENEADEYNNVEQVIWSPAPKDPVAVCINARKMFKDLTQDFAIAWMVSA